MLTYAELFAGAGGLSRGLEAAGWHAHAHAEIEPHARAVLRQHWPTTRLDGDVTQLHGSDYSGITLLSGGSPCQDLSVAGKRAGLAGARSGLFYEQVRIWQESDAPYLLWENVYGALSSNGGADFAAVLSALIGATVDVPVVRGKPKWLRAGVATGPAAVAAWRVLDLQHFGPPQRRVRVFVLAARTGGVDPAEVLDVTAPACQHHAPRSADPGPWWDGTGIVPALDCSGIVKQQTMPEKRRLWALWGRHWVPVVMSADVDAETDQCPQCGANYPTCPCPGPTQTREYRINGDTLEALVPWMRRLTPLECERLMSWPDHWTAHGVREDGTRYALSDTARYRLCGNGVGSVQVQWIAQRLRDAHLALDSQQQHS